MDFRALSVIFLTLVAFAAADTPANCTHADLKGKWIITESERGRSTTENCTGNIGKVKRVFEINFSKPDIVRDNHGNKIGFWTVVYNQGVAFVIEHRKYFAFSKYTKEGEKVTSYCGSTFPGWSHDVLGKNWACYTAKSVDRKPEKHYTEPPRQKIELPKPGLDDVLGGKSWKATVYPQFEDLTTEELILRAGGPRSRVISPPGPAKVTMEQRILDDKLPESFDWRNVSGRNFVSPVRNQGSCGSCYAFASMAMLEARLRIATNNKNKVILSPQDIVGCSEYSQGCAGGFPYLIAGKYAQDFGVVSEKCFHYKGHDTKCLEKKKNCTRYYVSDYNYVGGYYGATNEIAMKAALVKNGPIAVSFEVTPDFMTYSSGIYHENNPNPKGFQATNHAVLAVGYGVDKATGTNYWIIKNSWGKTWGENGFFRIRRGKDDLHIESCSVEATPIPY